MGEQGWRESGSLDGGEAVCKRICLRDDGQAKALESKNPAYTPIRGSALEGLRVVGKVTRGGHGTRTHIIRVGNKTDEYRLRRLYRRRGPKCLCVLEGRLYRVA